MASTGVLLPHLYRNIFHSHYSVLIIRSNHVGVGVGIQGRIRGWKGKAIGGGRGEGGGCCCCGVLSFKKI